MKKEEIYNRVTSKIIEILKSHKELNYSASWLHVGQFAKNAVSGKFYNGLNQLMLSFDTEKAGYPLNNWLTFNQIRKNGGKLKKGSRAEIVTFWKFLYFDENGKNITKLIESLKVSLTGNVKASYFKKVPVLRYFNVFNVAQTEDLPERFYKLPEPIAETMTQADRDKEADKIIKNTGANIQHLKQNKACYVPSLDYIKLPEVEQFFSPEDLYKTIFHELGHWTGHVKRLNRDMSGRFGDKSYAKEELIAELCSAFLCQSVNYKKTITSNAAYIENWLQALENDNKFIVSASSKAQKAANFIFSFTDKKTPKKPTAEKKAV